MSSRKIEELEARLEASEFQVKRKQRSRQTSFSVDSSPQRPSVEISKPILVETPKSNETFAKINKNPSQTSILSAKIAQSPISNEMPIPSPIVAPTPEPIQDFSLIPSSFDSKLHSYGPYVRVYDKNQQSPERKAKQQMSPVKYTSIIDVSSNKEKLYSTTYPTVIKIPPTITKVQVSVSPSTKSVLRPGTGSPSIITLSRPTSSKARYQRSNPRSNSSTRPDLPTIPQDPTMPNLPFLQMTNALQLHLKLRVLEDSERIMVWAPGSFLIQSSPFVEEKKRTFSLSDLFKPKEEAKDYSKAPPHHFPAYLLLTNKYVYVAKPLFRLAKLKQPLQDEQTSYLNPSKLIDICYKIPILESSRIDVGPGRQYLVFHSIQKSNEKETIFSVLFQTRSRHTTTVIIDTITTLIHEQNELNPLEKTPTINQDVEWCIKSIQDQVLLYPGPKSTAILSYSHIWPISEKYIELGDEEFDSGIHEQISKVDFDFVKMYLFGAFLRYIKPVVDTELRGVEIQHTTILGSRDYIYLLQERLDAWPPSVFPPDTTKNYPSFPIQGRDKGYLIDVVPQFQLLGVGRMDDVTRIERWRSWRIDESFGDGDPQHQFKGLGAALQNGHIGYFNKVLSHMHQQANASGWFWWVRIHFGTVTDSSVPISSPKQVPICGYWWDLVFSSRESSEDFIDTIKAMKAARKSDCKIIIGDD